LALLPEDEKPGCLFQGLFLERLPVEMRDHLVSREFKNPSEMALYADSLWDARKAIPTDHLLAAASTSSSSPSRGRAQDRRSPSPNRHSQTPGPSNSECYFHKRFGPAANDCALLAVSRETPEPTGGGKIKQSSRWPLSCVPSRCPVKPWLFSGHWSFKTCVSSSFLSCTDRLIPLQFGSCCFQF